ncbi:MAG: alpha/beta hydrolase [Bacteroidota bacterium]
MEKQTLQYRGHAIQTYAEGSGHHLVLLHGWPTNARLWDHQATYFRKHYRVIRFDWLGFGASDKPLDHTYTFTDMSGQLELVIQSLIPANEKITLVGHDVGGPPAVLWASENPERVHCLTLLNTMAYPLKTPLDAWSERLLSIPLLKDIFVSPFGLNRVLKVGTKRRDKAIKQHIKTILEPYRSAPAALKRKTLEEPMHHGRQHELIDLAERYGNIPIDKRLMIAKLDPLCYEHIHKLSQQYPDVPANILHRVGHFLPIDDPQMVTTYLMKSVPSWRKVVESPTKTKEKMAKSFMDLEPFFKASPLPEDRKFIAREYLPKAQELAIHFDPAYPVLGLDLQPGTKALFEVIAEHSSDRNTYHEEQLLEILMGFVFAGEGVDRIQKVLVNITDGAFDAEISFDERDFNTQVEIEVILQKDDLSIRKLLKNGPIVAKASCTIFNDFLRAKGVHDKKILIVYPETLGNPEYPCFAYLSEHQAEALRELMYLDVTGGYGGIMNWEDL